MDIIYFTGGAREKSLSALIEKGFNIVAVVCPRPSKSNSRFVPSVLIALENDIPVITVDKDNILEKVQDIGFDILLSCGFSYILEPDVIRLARYLAVNVHPTLLPKYRGFRSGPFIIINGEQKSGVTIHELISDMDKGDIFMQREFLVTPFDTTKSLFRKSQEVEGELLIDFFDKLNKGKLDRIEQNESEATTYNEIRRPKDSVVDPNKSLLELYNYIRACDPIEFPAYFYIGNEKVCIKLWRPNNSNEFDMI
jgi:methionyl-tRNA formyltransferase